MITACPHPVVENGSRSPISLLSCGGNQTIHIVLHAVWKLSNEYHHLRSINRPTTLSSLHTPGPPVVAERAHGDFQAPYSAREAQILPGVHSVFERNLTISGMVLIDEFPLRSGKPVVHPLRQSFHAKVHDWAGNQNRVSGIYHKNTR